MSPYLQFQSIEKRYGDVAALNGVTLGIERGCVLALLGPNGAGKSTLFGCLLGFTRPTRGAIRIEGVAPTASFHGRIGYMPERIALYPQSSVRENGMFFAQLKRQPTSEFERQLKRVGLYDVQDRTTGKLSKGMLQRLGLAIALCGAPELLVLDEPFNGLDPALLETLQTILVAERERGATLLISTHTLSAIEPLATDVAVLLEGRLAAAGSVEALRETHGDLSIEAIYHAIARSRAEIGAGVCDPPERVDAKRLTEPRSGPRVCDSQQLRLPKRLSNGLRCLETPTLLRLTEPRSAGDKTRPDRSTNEALV